MLVLCLSLTSLVSHAQTETKTFNITNNGTVTLSDLPKYENAILTANMESFRNKTTRTTLYFDNGLTIELLSAQELYILGVNINPNDYVDSRDPKFTFPTFHLTNEGHLLAFYQSIGK